MSETIKQQPEGDLHDKYTLKGEGFVWPLIRSVLIFIGTLLVAIVGAEVEAGGGLDPFAIVYCVLLTPFAFINAFFFEFEGGFKISNGYSIISISTASRWHRPGFVYWSACWLWRF